MIIEEEVIHGQNDDLDELKKHLFEKVIPRLLRPLETGGRSITPCLIHTDL
jgi:protein-ribulosamine 3-kinase